MKITAWYQVDDLIRERAMEINDIELSEKSGHERWLHIMEHYVRPWMGEEIRCGYKER